MIFLKTVLPFLVGQITASKMDYHANIQQRSFLATFNMDVFLIRCSFWDIYIFSNYRKWWRHFMNNWWHFDIFQEFLISPELLIIWNCATTHFNQKTQLMGVIILKYIILRTGSGLKLLFLTKTAIFRQFVYSLYHYLYDITSPLKLVRKS